MCDLCQHYRALRANSKRQDQLVCQHLIEGVKRLFTRGVLTQNESLLRTSE
jgi:hypothetical protein